MIALNFFGGAWTSSCLSFPSRQHATFTPISRVVVRTRDAGCTAQSDQPREPAKPFRSDKSKLTFLTQRDRQGITFQKQKRPSLSTTSGGPVPEQRRFRMRVLSSIPSERISSLSIAVILFAVALGSGIVVSAQE